MVKNKHNSVIRLRFTYKGSEFEGVLISEDQETYLVKLSNGYNLTIPRDSVNILERRELNGPEEIGSGKILSGKGKKVTLIGSGGTIASRVDYSTGAVKPVYGTEFLHGNISNFEHFELELKVLPPVFSEDMTPVNWQNIARSVYDGLKNSDGVVVMHGTDTMAYTASALAFMFEKQSGPIIFTGSQRSSDRPSSDAFLNIEGSLEFASTDLGEVCIAMHEGLSDTTINLLRGVRTRKMHSSRRDAFKSIGYPELAEYSNGKIKFKDAYRKTDDKNELKDKLESRVSLIYFNPILTNEDFETLAMNKRAVVLAGTGLGHVSNRFVPIIRQLSKSGIKFYMTTQCIYGSVNMNVYSTGRELRSAGVIPLGNMLSEVALVKSMFVFANYDSEEVDRKMKENLRGEIMDREVPFGSGEAA
ncbi:MAG: Glu-tRNA(Gln) amidotransferase subunit GatD [Thermoplasmatales archaeon]|nr:Glu-tRNA(Gln) amidotransferase subunit GatD [Thermoplasmatales archaeon]MCW6169675.1 Glu-tRNA(Gln) amidotransferase subunit GatD [Thermoplasmatales archaeon]